MRLYRSVLHLPPPSAPPVIPFRRLGIFLILLAIGYGRAFGAPVTWTLHSVVFNDGGTATGSFVYNADTNQVTAWKISVAGGDTSVFPPFTYSPASGSFCNFPNGSIDEYVFSASVTSLCGSARFLRFVFAASLTDAGGQIDIDVSPSTQAGECYNCNPWRQISSGYITAPSGISTPAPWLSFAQGDPGVPGDGIKIQGTQGIFYDLTTPIPFLAIENGFAATAFPPRSTSVPVAFQLNISNFNPESACDGDGIGVSWGTQEASFKVNGVQGYSLTVSATGVTGLVGYMNQIYPGCQMTVADLSLGGFVLSNTPTLDAMALEAVGLSLSFPVKQDSTGSGVCGAAPCTPYTAPINTVFDHQMHIAYECSAGVGGYGTILPFTDQLVEGNQSHTGYGLCGKLYGYRYTGSSPFLEWYNYDVQQNGQFVYYDSHPGYDYNFSFGTAIYPAVNGCVTYLQTAAGVKTAAAGHILAIIPQATQPVGGCQTVTTDPVGYSVVYMHLSSYYQGDQNRPHYGSVMRCKSPDGTGCGVCTTCAPQNAYVTTDQTNAIGYTGNFFSGWGGVPSHLHFEVDQLSGTKPIIAVDPYGWCGSQYSDPYTNFTGMLNVPLWANFNLLCP